MEITLFVFKETERAVAINNPNYGSYLSGVSGNVDLKEFIWIPKSVCKIEGDLVVDIAQWFCDKTPELSRIVSQEKQEFIESRFEKYEKLIAWAKSQGVKVRARMKRITVLDLIAQAGLQVPVELK